MKNYYLGREEAYIASPQVWSFRSVDDIVNGINLRLSNMAGGFPFECSGRVWKDSVFFTLNPHIVGICKV